MPRAAPSLEIRALRYLAQREHSRTELRRKLLRYAEDPAEVDALLDRLAAEHWQDDARFAQSLLHRRRQRHGNLRIAQELARYGVDAELVAQSLDALAEDELPRARAVWQRRFGHLPADAAERARQQRFLAARGFTAATIRAVLRGAGSDVVDDASDPDESG